MREWEWKWYNYIFTIVIYHKKYNRVPFILYRYIYRSSSLGGHFTTITGIPVLTLTFLTFSQTPTGWVPTTSGVLVGDSLRRSWIWVSLHIWHPYVPPCLSSISSMARHLENLRGECSKNRRSERAGVFVGWFGWSWSQGEGCVFWGKLVKLAETILRRNLEKNP